MKQLLWYVGCCWTLSLVSASAAHAGPDIKSSTNGDAASLGEFSNTDYHATTATPAVANGILAQTPPAPPAPETPSSAPATAPTSPALDQESKDIQERLKNINNSSPGVAPDKYNTYQPITSPGFAIFNPVGFGIDNNTIFLALSYQNRTRFTQTSDAEGGIGIGLGDAYNSIGVELSYSINSFGSSAAFGSGAFNAKLHKRLSEDSAVAIGWNQFAKTQFGPGRNGDGPSDYPNNSYYAVGTKIFRTREDINEPFSRVAVTGGVGGGVFLPFDGRTLDRTGLSPFGSVGVRVARPVSAIVEWTGQDLSAGLSIAPFDNFPLVLTPAFRDIAGVTDPGNNRSAGARFIMGASVAFNF